MTIVHLAHDLANAERTPPEHQAFRPRHLGQPHDRQVAVGASDRKPEVDRMITAHDLAFSSEETCMEDRQTSEQPSTGRGPPRLSRPQPNDLRRRLTPSTMKSSLVRRCSLPRS